MEQLLNRDNALIVGAGRVGERFANALVAQNFPTAIYDIVPEKALALSRRLGTLHADNLDAAMDQSQVVYICSPISQHFESASKAVEAEKAVFCEKPLTSKLHEALDLQKIVHQKATPFIVGNYYRLNSSILALKHAIEQGEIGQVIAINAIYLHDMRSLNEETPWREEEGFWYDGTVHPVDLACWIADERVEKVQAVSGIKIDSHPHPTDIRLNLQFASGLLANIWANARAILPEHGAEIFILGTKGTMRAFNKNEFYEIYNYGQGDFVRVLTPQGALPIDRTVTIVQDFIAGRSDNYYPLPGIDEAVESIRILDWAQRVF